MIATKSAPLAGKVSEQSIHVMSEDVHEGTQPQRCNESMPQASHPLFSLLPQPSLSSLTPLSRTQASPLPHQLNLHPLPPPFTSPFSSLSKSKLPCLPPPSSLTSGNAFSSPPTLFFSATILALSPHTPSPLSLPTSPSIALTAVGLNGHSPPETTPSSLPPICTSSKFPSPPLALRLNSPTSGASGGQFTPVCVGLVAGTSSPFSFISATAFLDTAFPTPTTTAG